MYEYTTHPELDFVNSAFLGYMAKKITNDDYKEKLITLDKDLLMIFKPVKDDWIFKGETYLAISSAVNQLMHELNYTVSPTYIGSEKYNEYIAKLKNAVREFIENHDIKNPTNIKVLEEQEEFLNQFAKKDYTDRQIMSNQLLKQINELSATIKSKNMNDESYENEQAEITELSTRFLKISDFLTKTYPISKNLGEEFQEIRKTAEAQIALKLEEENKESQQKLISKK